MRPPERSGASSRYSRLRRSTLIAAIGVFILAGCGHVASEHPTSDGGADRPSSGLDARSHEAAGDGALDASSDAQRDSSSPCSAGGLACEDGGVCQAGQCKVCPTRCATDTDCTDRCPAVPEAINCCNADAGVCFMSVASTCPGPLVNCQTSAQCAPGSCCDPTFFICEPSDAACPLPTCASQCHANSDCQSRCPAAPQGLQNCCSPDTQACQVTQYCYGELPPEDGGTEAGVDDDM
jgi:hypothetical protein